MGCVSVQNESKELRQQLCQQFLKSSDAIYICLEALLQGNRNRAAFTLYLNITHEFTAYDAQMINLNFKIFNHPHSRDEVASWHLLSFIIDPTMVLRFSDQWYETGSCSTDRINQGSAVVHHPQIAQAVSDCCGSGWVPEGFKVFRGLTMLEFH